jgi:hypothetical protein
MQCRYVFPCEGQALFTQDVPVAACANFEDSTFALHRIELPCSTPLTEHLSSTQGEGASDAVLVFELFDCFEEGADDLHAVGTLPMAAILSAAQECLLAQQQVWLPQASLLFGQAACSRKSVRCDLSSTYACVVQILLGLGACHCCLHIGCACKACVMPFAGARRNSSDCAAVRS